MNDSPTSHARATEKEIEHQLRHQGDEQPDAPPFGVPHSHQERVSTTYSEDIAMHDEEKARQHPEEQTLIVEP